jgi:activator of HSP90 ATPase
MRPELPISFVINSVLSDIHFGAWDKAKNFISEKPPSASEVLQIFGNGNEGVMTPREKPVRIRIEAAHKSNFDSLELVRTLKSDNTNTEYSYRILGINVGEEDEITDLGEYNQEQLKASFGDIEKIMDQRKKLPHLEIENAKCLPSKKTINEPDQLGFS